MPSTLKIISDFENDITHEDFIGTTLGNIDPLTSETFQLILSKRIAELVADIRQAILEIQIGTNNQQNETCS